MTRTQKLAAARRYVLDNSGKLGSTTTEALRLTLDLIETSEDALPIPTYSAPLDANDGVSSVPDFAAMAEELSAGLDARICSPETQQVWLAKWLAANWPKPAPAFDVEALVAGVQPYWAKHGCTVYDAIRAVAREMLAKGGGR